MFVGFFWFVCFSVQMMETLSLKDIGPVKWFDTADIWICLNLIWHDHSKIIILNGVFFSRH